jgi:protein-S-isoprenylcysteine O-methyltransferase Ste14
MSVRTTAAATRPLWHHGPSWLWLLTFVIAIGGDAILGRWVLLPIYMAGFYGGMIVIDLLTYPMLDRWRAWLQRRGLMAWYAIEVGLMWLGTTLLLIVLAPNWLTWTWRDPATVGLTLFQILGAIMLVVSLGVSVWAAGQMGWARLLFAAALFPPGKGAEQHNIPQFLVVSGPYRYVRNPLYVTDMTLILATGLLTQNWFFIWLLLAYIGQLIIQIRLEERELRARFGAQYERYCSLVPRFVPRLTPVDSQVIREG